MSDDYLIHRCEMLKDEVKRLREMYAGSACKNDLQAARIFTLTNDNTALSLQNEALDNAVTALEARVMGLKERVTDLKRLLAQAQSVAIGEEAARGYGPRYASIRDEVWDGGDAA